MTTQSERGQIWAEGETRPAHPSDLKASPPHGRLKRCRTWHSAISRQPHPRLHFRLYSPSRLPLRGMAMKEPRLPPMTLWGRRKGGFRKDPAYWCRKECMLWEVGGRPFLTMGSVDGDVNHMNKISLASKQYIILENFVDNRRQQNSDINASGERTSHRRKCP